MEYIHTEVMECNDGTWAARVRICDTEATSELVKHHQPKDTFKTRMDALEWAASLDLDE